MTLGLPRRHVQLGEIGAATGRKRERRVRATPAHCAFGRMPALGVLDPARGTITRSAVGVQRQMALTHDVGAFAGVVQLCLQQVGGFVVRHGPQQCLVHGREDVLAERAGFPLVDIGEQLGQQHRRQQAAHQHVPTLRSARRGLQLACDQPDHAHQSEHQVHVVARRHHRERTFSTTRQCQRSGDQDTIEGQQQWQPRPGRAAAQPGNRRDHADQQQDAPKHCDGRQRQLPAHQHRFGVTHGGAHRVQQQHRQVRIDIETVACGRVGDRSAEQIRDHRQPDRRARQNAGPAPLGPPARQEREHLHDQYGADEGVVPAHAAHQHDQRRGKYQGHHPHRRTARTR
ncbi:hypothetical protein D3C72_1288910 [compost metagenome]